MKGQRELIEIIKEVAKGKYSNDIMELTKPGYPDPIREIAEAVGMMMVKIEAREFWLDELNKQLKENIIKSVSSIADALGARDEYTEGHGLRVALYAERLARRLGLPENEIGHIKTAGILHDIGKIGFSDRVFSDEDTTPVEELLLEIRQHPVQGYEILRNLDFLGPVLEYVLCHHERLDGKGYPGGKTSDEIPIGAKILSVADCFDAMTTDRPYKKGKALKEAFVSLQEMGGCGLDPDIVAVFLDEIREGGME